MNIPAPLLPLFDEGLLDEVLRPLMSGKEASVYMVRARGEICVAKVYKDATNRTFRQRAAYTEGRQVRSSRARRAMQKGSTYGKSLLEAEWQNTEVEALYRLHEAGVRVPVPYHHAENVLLMEMVADADGEPAPRLYDVELTRETASLLHQILIRDLVRMLCAGLVHGDLSEYNILVAPDGPVIIDFPQATDAAHNQNSERLFKRDANNLAQFLGRAAPELRRTRFGHEIWDLFRRAELHPDVELTGRFVDKTEKVDPNAALSEIRAAAQETEAARPPSAYQLKKQRRAEALRAARAEEAKAPPTDPGSEPRSSKPSQPSKQQEEATSSRRGSRPDKPARTADAAPRERAKGRSGRSSSEGRSDGAGPSGHRRRSGGRRRGQRQGASTPPQDSQR